MREKGIRQLFVLLVAVALSPAAQAFQEIPRESAKALRVTRGKAFSSGAVFINGKYIEPPYVVERWGTGIRINKEQVTGQIIDWNEFLKTQSGVKVSRSEPAPMSAPESAPLPASAPAASDDSADESSLDDLFDDDPKPKKKPVAATVQKPVAPKPRPTVSYSLDGGFIPNDASKKLLSRINAMRTDIDRILRSGGFICFGDRYSQVTGDARTLQEMLEKLPELMQRSSDLQSFNAGVRAAHLVYFHDELTSDLYANRFYYRQLKSLRAKIKEEKELNELMRKSSKSFF